MVYCPSPLKFADIFSRNYPPKKVTRDTIAIRHLDEKRGILESLINPEDNSTNLINQKFTV